MLYLCDAYIRKAYMKKLIFVFFVSIVALCSCDERLSDDGLGLAVRLDEVPEIGIKESQLHSKMYTEEEFLGFVDGYCYERVAAYAIYRKDGGTYYVIVCEGYNGEYILNTLERSELPGRDIRLFENGELVLWLGALGGEGKHLYKYSFNTTKQHLEFGGSRDYVVYIDNEYLIIEGQTLKEITTGEIMTSSYVVKARTVYRRTNNEGWLDGEVRDYRNVNFGGL